MIQKILRDYMEKLQNLIPDEIREYVDTQFKTDKIILFLTACDGSVSSFEIKIGHTRYTNIGSDLGFNQIIFYIAGTSDEVNEEMILKKINSIKDNYNEIYKNQIGKFSLNPATKKLLEIAKQIRKEAPEEIRWGMEINIAENGYVTLKFPMNIEEIQTSNYKGSCIVWFMGNLILLEASYLEKEPIRLHGTLEENEKRFSTFLKDLAERINNF